jgi:hypothetical protein
MNMTPSELFDAVERQCPSFQAITAEHMKNNGELLSHLLLADLLRFVGSGLGTPCNLPAAPPSREAIQGILSLLDRAFIAGDEETRGVISLSFIENIETEPFYSELLPLLGAALRGEHRRQRDWWKNAR